MSSKRLSPTGRALRSSRFFSLPTPLQRPSEYVSGNSFTDTPQSNTATLPYPVQQAIASTPSSASRGDWGLKRSLPPRSLRRVNNPTFRIHAVDTREHITDFESAWDLTATRKKYAELTAPLKVKDSRLGVQRDRTKSAFDSSLDNTDINVAPIDPTTGEESRRWKFEGPWLLAMTESEFLTYVEKRLRGRKQEFLAFLRDHEERRQRSNKAHAETAAHGRGQIHASRMGDREFATLLNQKRNSFHSNADLGTLIARFLDLPDVGLAQDTPPLQTHPSGGLGYLRTEAILRNHELFGPLTGPEPFPARRVSPEISGRHLRRVGMAGFVAQEPQARGALPAHLLSEVTAELNSARENNNPLARQDRNRRSIGVGVTGGTRMWLQAPTANIDDAGRVHLQTVPANDGTVDAKLGQPGSTSVVGGIDKIEASSPPAQNAKAFDSPSAAVVAGQSSGGQYGVSENTSRGTTEETEDWSAMIAGLDKLAELEKHSPSTP